MTVKQINVFLENESGRLAEVAAALAKNKIDIRAVYVADTTDYGILRMLVNQPDEAQIVLQNLGFTVSQTPVIAVAILPELWIRFFRYCLRTISLLNISTHSLVALLLMRLL